MDEPAAKEIGEFFTEKMKDVLEEHLDALLSIWRDIGVEKNDALVRVETLCRIADNFMKRAVNEERNKKNLMLESIEKYGTRLFQLSRELEIPTVEPSEDLNLMSLERFLRDQLETAKAERTARLTKFEELKEREKTLTAELAAAPLNMLYNQIPTLSQLGELERHVEKLKKDKDYHFCTFNALKGIITRLMEDLEMTEYNSFESVISNVDGPKLSKHYLNAMKKLKEKLDGEVACNASKAEGLRKRLHHLWTLMKVPFEDRSDFKHTLDHRPSTIVNLENEVERYEEQKKENIQVYVTKMREQLLMFWDLCLYSQKQKDAFRAYRDGDFNEELLQSHETELQRLKDYYSECEAIFSLFTKRSELWKKMLDLEQNAKDASRFNNRGGKLLQEEKQRKKLMVLIPKLETDLKASAVQWEMEHNCELLIYGQPVAEYIDDQWQAHHEEKENERLARQHAKTKLLEVEMVSGSKPSFVAGKRPLISNGTPTSARAAKLAKVTTPLSLNILAASQKRAMTNTNLYNTPLGKPPKSSSKTTAVIVTKKRYIPRRLHNLRSGQSDTKCAAIFAIPELGLLDRTRVTAAATAQDQSTFSTYSEFQNVIHRGAEANGLCSTLVQAVTSSPTGDQSKTVVRV